MVPYSGRHLPTIPKEITVSQIWAMVGEDTCSRWEALGDTAGKVHWAYGSEAEALIVEGFPAMQVYKAIAIKAGVGAQVIRKAYRTYEAIPEEIREKYQALSYSVFQFAVTQEDPFKVLDYALKHRSSVDELEAVFRKPSEDPREKEFESLGYPRYFWGIWREVAGCPKKIVDEVTSHLDAIHKIIKEVEDK